MTEKIGKVSLQHLDCYINARETGRGRITQLFIAVQQWWDPNSGSYLRIKWQEMLQDFSFSRCCTCIMEIIMILRICSDLEDSNDIHRGFIRSWLPAVNCCLCCLSPPVTKPHIQESSSCNIKYRNRQKHLWVFVLRALICSCTATYLLPMAFY